MEERQVLGLHGLQPARFKSQEEQIELCKISINRYQEDLNKYLYLIDLQVSVKIYQMISFSKHCNNRISFTQDRNERLFFRLVSENVSSIDRNILRECNDRVTKIKLFN